jgi:hypothetical protein
MTIGAGLAHLTAQRRERLRSQFATLNVGLATDLGATDGK